MGKKNSKLTKTEKSNITRWYHEGLSILQISERTGITVTAVKARVRKVVTDECVVLWSKIIRQVGHCEMTGSTNKLNAHHLLEKGAFPQFKFDLSNGICLSEGVHSFDPQYSPHYSSHSRAGFWEWMEENRQGQYAWWQENRYNKKFVQLDIFQIHKDLTEIYEKGA